MKVKDACNKHKISDYTYYTYAKKKIRVPKEDNNKLIAITPIYEHPDLPTPSDDDKVVICITNFKNFKSLLKGL